MLLLKRYKDFLPQIVDEESTGCLSVDGSDIKWLLVNAVKQLSSQVEELKAEIDILKKKRLIILKMDNIKINYALIFAVILQAIGLIWYVSKLDSKVEAVYKFYQEESQKSVVVTQAKMKFDLELLKKDLVVIKADLKKNQDKSKEIVKQHGQIFDLLKNKKTVPSGYNYGN